MQLHVFFFSFTQYIYPPNHTHYFQFEKFLAIAYDGEDATHGRVIIFDLVKRKPHRVYETSAVTSLCWNHMGDMLYAGKLMNS